MRGEVMRIVVIGGTGLIGSKVVERLKQKGDEAIAAAPNTGVNTITGEGLKEAMAGAQVVIDLANSPSFEDKAVLEFFETPAATSSRRRPQRASRAASGHAAAPPSAASNSRRPMATVIRPSAPGHRHKGSTVRPSVVICVTDASAPAWNLTGTASYARMMPHPLSNPDLRRAYFFCSEAARR